MQDSRYILGYDAEPWRWVVVLCMCIIAAAMWFLPSMANASGLGGTISGLLSTGTGSGYGTVNAVETFCQGVSTGAGDTNILIGKMIPCMEQLIYQVAVSMNGAVGNIVYPIVSAGLTLLVVLYGLSILRGEGELTKRGIIFLLKVAAVLALTDGLGGMIPNVFAMLSEMQGYAASGLASFVGAGAQCPEMSKYGDAGAMIDPVWVMMDCTLGKLFGFADTTFIGSSVFGILAAAAFSGTMGVQVFFMGILALASMVFLVIRAAYAYMTTYMYIAFMIVISPMFIPFLAGSGMVFQIFERFLKSCISAFFVPVFLFGYLVIAMNMLDAVLFSDTAGNGLRMSSTFKEIIDKNQNDYMGAPKAHCDTSIVKDPKFSEKTGITGDSGWVQTIGLDVITSIFSGAKGLDICNFKTPQLEFSDDKLKELGMDMFKIAIVIYILIVVMDIVLDIAQQTMMGGYALINAAERKNVVESTVKGALDGGKKAAVDLVDGGGDFGQAVAGSVTHTIGGAYSGFMQSFR